MSGLPILELAGASGGVSAKRPDPALNYSHYNTQNKIQFK
jgi:hypothetical protein